MTLPPHEAVPVGKRGSAWVPWIGFIVIIGAFLLTIWSVHIKSKNQAWAEAIKTVCAINYDFAKGWKE